MLCKQRCQLARALIDQFIKRNFLELQRLRASEVQKCGDHFRETSDFLQQRLSRRARLFIVIDALQKLGIAVQRGHGVLELVSQAGGHLAQTFEISFERYLLAQARYFGNVG